MRYSTEDKIRLILVRHGAVRANLEHRYIGKTDDSLADEGVSKLMEGVSAGIYPSADLVFTSPMKRCIETAGIIYPDKTPVIIPEWSEIDFGRFEGKDHNELKNDRDYQAWIDSNGRLPFPDGEDRGTYIKRCIGGFERMSNSLGGDLKSVAMIVHGGTIMSLLSTLYGGDYYDYLTPNGEGYTCTLTVQNGSFIISDVDRLGLMPCINV
ncbi:MAG: histidine phosphatase family protein [Lachnospiraceae bacterium]|nr:histidine phosphatase family protein [Lachnospiraceae bacterium]